MTKQGIWRALILVLVVLSLALNAALIVGALRVREGLVSALAGAEDALALLSGEPIAFDVAVDQEIPIQTTVPIEETFVVPIDFDYALDTVVETYVDIPILGRQDIAFPVQTVLPINTSFEIPVEMAVPISVTYQLQTDIPVEVELPSELLDAFDDLIGQLSAILDPLPK